MRWLLPIIWAGLISYLSFIPANNFPDDDLFHLLFIDKWVHAFFYFFFAFLLLNAWREISPVFLKAFVILIATVSFGLLIEVLQEKLTSTRHFEWLDLVADAFGSISYIFIWLRRRSKDFL